MKRLMLLAAVALLAACATNKVDPLLIPPDADQVPQGNAT